MFKGRHNQSVIRLFVRWYLAYGLSLRDLKEMMAERGNAPQGMDLAMQVDLFEAALSEPDTEPDLVNQVIEITAEDEETCMSCATLFRAIEAGVCVKHPAIRSAARHPRPAGSQAEALG